MVAKLVLSMDGLVLKEIPLNKQRISIGRKPHNNVQIDNLAISGEHCVVVTILDNSFLEDLNSTNGTYVNGQPIKKHVLTNRDVIELGKYRLKYLLEDEESDPDSRRAPPIEVPDAAAAAAPAARNANPGPDATQPLDASGPAFDVTQIMPPPPSALQAYAEANPQPVAKKDRIGAVQVLNGSNAGRQLDLTKSLSKLGKPGVQVATIARRDDGYFITHLEGEKFPFVNGRSIGPQAHFLREHDIIEVAGVKMEFFLRDS